MARPKGVFLARSTIQGFLDEGCMTLAASWLSPLFLPILLLIAVFGYAFQSAQELLLTVAGNPDGSIPHSILQHLARFI